MSATSPAERSFGGTCRTVTKASRSSFTYAFMVLPKPQREALYAIYAFCRISDDLVDQPAFPDVAGSGSPAATVPAERLGAWRAELDACFRGAPTHPVTRRLAEVLRTIPIPRVYFESLLSGMEMDLVKTRYASFAELEQYCYRVAGVVGLMCIEIFGYTRPETRIYAERLGTAFQLTNILRDLGQDGEAGRIYLPQEDLARFGCTEADILGHRLTPAFRELMNFEVGRARAFTPRPWRRSRRRIETPCFRPRSCESSTIACSPRSRRGPTMFTHARSGSPTPDACCWPSAAGRGTACTCPRGSDDCTPRSVI